MLRVCLLIPLGALLLILHPTSPVPTAVEAAGGRVELVPLLEGHSTSRLLKKIRAP